MVSGFSVGMSPLAVNVMSMCVLQLKVDIVFIETNLGSCCGSNSK